MKLARNQYQVLRYLATRPEEIAGIDVADAMGGVGAQQRVRGAGRAAARRNHRRALGPQRLASAAVGADQRRGAAGAGLGAAGADGRPVAGGGGCGVSVHLQASESNVFTRPVHGALEFAIARLLAPVWLAVWLAVYPRGRDAVL